MASRASRGCRRRRHRATTRGSTCVPRELALTADVTAAYLTLTTAARTAALQEQNSAKAKLELKFTQDRYQQRRSELSST